MYVKNIYHLYIYRFPNRLLYTVRILSTQYILFSGSHMWHSFRFLKIPVLCVLWITYDHLSIYVCMHVYVCIPNIYMYIHICICIYIYIYIYIYLFTYLVMYIFIYIYIYIYIYIHIYTYIYVHIYVCPYVYLMMKLKSACWTLLVESIKYCYW